MERVYRLAVRARNLALPLRYSVAICLVSVASGLHWWVLGPGPGYAFVFFYPAVIVSGAFLDLGTAIFTTALSAAIGIYLFVPPVQELAIGARRDLAAALMFVANAGFMALLLEAGHRTFSRMTQAQHALETVKRESLSASTQLVRARTEMEALLHESVHRFRNDLQRLGATIALQMAAAKHPAAQAALREVQDRVNALYAIKARLDLSLMPGDGHTLVEARPFLSGLVEDWAATIGMRPVAFKVRAEAHWVPASRAVLLGLILNELMTNAVKYAFPNDRPGTVWVDFHREDDHYLLCIEDDGVGMDPAAAPQGTGLGGRIVRALAGQLGGRLEITPRPGGGTVCRLTVPVTVPS